MKPAVFQLSLDFLPHRALRDRDPDRPPVLDGSLKLSGSLACPTNLDSGDELIVTVALADGQVLSHHYAEVEYAYPKPISVKDIGIVGTERVHKVKVGDRVEPEDLR